jgi:hypothetical protein
MRRLIFEKPLIGVRAIGAEDQVAIVSPREASQDIDPELRERDLMRLVVL